MYCAWVNLRQAGSGQSGGGLVYMPFRVPVSFHGPDSAMPLGDAALFGDQPAPRVYVKKIIAIRQALLSRTMLD